MDNSKCAILVPVGFMVEPETQQLLDVLASRGYVVRTMRGSSQVDLARSTMACDALKDGFEETFWIDSDQSFDPDDVDRVRALDLPFVAGMYPCKGPKRLAGKLLPGSRLTFGAGGGVHEVEYCGMGFTYVRSEVYLAIQRMGLPLCAGGYSGATVLPFFQPMLLNNESGPPGTTYLSEDYSFCVRARQAGFPPHVDTRIKVGHVGRYRYTWDDLMPDIVLASLEVEQQPSGEIVAVSAMGMPMNYRSAAMGITREALLGEQASLEQQIAQHQETIQRADVVKAKADSDLTAVNGAMQMVRHLLTKLDAVEDVHTDDPDPITELSKQSQPATSEQ